MGPGPFLYEDYENIKLLLNAPLKDVHKFSALVDEYKKMFKHLDRHRNEVVFMKREDDLCFSEFRSTSFLEEYENDDKTFDNEGQRSAVTDVFFLKDRESSSYFTLPSKAENSKHYQTG